MKHPENGLTMIEAILALGVLTLVTTAGFMLILQIFKAQNFNLEQSDAIAQAQKGMKVMVAEMREAAIAENGAYPIATADDDTFIFYSDIDTDLDREQITYQLTVDNTITRTLIEPVNQVYDPANGITETLVSYIVASDAIFSYFNGDYPVDMNNNPLVTPANPIDVKLIHIRLHINPKPGQVPEDFLVESDVQPRNLKENL